MNTLENAIKELDSRLDEMAKSLAVMNNNVSRQAKVIDKLVASFDKLTVFIERTNENDKKISTLFKKVDFLQEHGTKNCPVQMERVKRIEDDIVKVNHRIDYMQKVLVAIAVSIIMQFLGILVYLIEKHII